MKKYLLFIPLLLLIFSSINVNASHVVGGDVEYECIGPRTWKIRLTLYRDCTGAQFCSNMNCTQGMTARPSTTLNPSGCTATPNNVPLTMHLVKVEDISKSSRELCGSSAKNGCNNLGQVVAGTYTPSVEKYIFEGTLNLSNPSLNNSNCTYWDVFWTLCCRNANIWNLTNSSSQDFRIGATINIFNQSASLFKNNSPILKNEPVIVVCANQEIVYNMGGLDPDGDLLTYEIVPSLNNSGTSVTYQAPGSPTYPFPLYANKPPHSNYPQPNGPYVVIDSTTGYLSFNGINNTASYIPGNLSILIKQWANDSNGAPLLVGITSRDVQMLLVNCPVNIPPKLAINNVLPSNNTAFKFEVNAGQQLCFLVTAKDSNVTMTAGVDTTYISWDSSLVKPGRLTFGPTYTVGIGQPRPREDQWQFCWQTDSTDGRDLPYTFTVTAIDKSCPSVGKITKSFNILVKNTPAFSSIKTAIPCGRMVCNLYKNKSDIIINTATFQISTSPNDRNFVNGFRTISPVNLNPNAAPGDTLNQPRLMVSDSFSYLIPGKYYTRLYYGTSTPNFIKPYIDSIEIGSNMTVAFISTNKPTTICDRDSILLSSSLGQAHYKYQWMLNNINIPNATAGSLWVKTAGIYNLVVNDTLLGCINYSNPININVNPRPVANFYSPSLCTKISQAQAFIDISSISSGSTKRNWQFGSTINNTDTAVAINKVFNNIGGIDVKLVSTSNFGCKDSITRTYYVDPPIFWPTTSTSTSCEKDTTVLSVTAPSYFRFQWLKNNLEIPGAIQAIYKATTSGRYSVLCINNFNNCLDTGGAAINLALNPKPVPVAKFLANNLCISNSNLIFADSSTIQSGSYTRLWRFGDGTTSTAISGNKLYNNPGSYTVKLILTSDKNCKDSSFSIVNISSPPIPNIIANTSTNICDGKSVLLSSTAYPNINYYWYKDNVFLNSADTNILVATQQGSYKLIIADGTGCKDTSNTIAVQVYPVPSPSTQLSSNNICFTNRALVYNESSTILSGTFTRLWDFADGTTSTTKSGSKLFTNAGSYQVKLILTSNNGCKDSLVELVTVGSLPVANISANANTSFCEGKSVELSNAAHQNASYTWYRNNQLLSNSNSNKLLAELSGNYKLIVDIGGSCKDTSNSISVLVYPSPKVGFTLNNDKQCLNGNSFFVNDTSFISSGSYTRTWTWGNNTSSLQSLNFNFLNAGSYQVKLKATSNNSCSDSIIKTVVVVAQPNIGNITGQATLLDTLQVYNYSVNQQLNHNYKWTITNGTIITNQDTNSIKAQWLAQGTGIIKAVITNNDACSDSVSLMVSVGINAPQIISFTPQTGTNGTVVTINGGNFNNTSAVAFGGVNAKSFTLVSPTVITAIVDTGATGSVSVVTPNGTALLNTFTYTLGTGLTEIGSQSYSIYPNPVYDEVIIESNKSLNNATFQLMDVNGKVVYTYTNNQTSTKVRLDIKNISPSLYLLRIKLNGQSNTVKIIKQ